MKLYETDSGPVYDSTATKEQLKWKLRDLDGEVHRQHKKLEVVKKENSDMAKYISDMMLYISDTFGVEAVKGVIKAAGEGYRLPHVAVKVSGGLVQAVYADALVLVEVFDLDVSDFPDDGEADEAAERAAEIEKIASDPAYHCAW